MLFTKNLSTVCHKEMSSAKARPYQFCTLCSVKSGVAGRARNGRSPSQRKVFFS